MVHIDLVVPYIKSIIQHKTGDATTSNDASLTFMTMINPATGWFEIIEVPMFYLDKVTGGNDKYIYR